MTSHVALLAPRAEAAIRARDFTGRHAALRRVDAWLHAADPRVLLVVGDIGSGKSALAARLVQISLGDASPPAGVRWIGLGCVGAVHFCSGRRSESLDPVVCARNLARQLAVTLPGFDTALLQTLSGLGGRTTTVNIDMRAGRVERQTAVENLTLNLGPMSALDAFSRFLAAPLQALAVSGGLSPSGGRVLLVVDALDEAQRRSADGDGITEMLKASDGLPDGVRLLLTHRRGVSALEGAFPGAEVLDLNRDPEIAAEGGHDAAQFALHGLRRALAGRGAAEPPDLAERAVLLVEAAAANFQYIRFAVDAVAAGQQALDDLHRMPPGLDGLYHATLGRILAVSGQSWPCDHAALLGVLAAALDPLPAVHLRGAAGLGRTRFYQVMSELRQFVREVRPAGEAEDAYQFWHESVVEFLRRDRIRLVPPAAPGMPPDLPPSAGHEIANPFFLPPDDGHAVLADWLRKGWRLGWSESAATTAEVYAMRAMTAHHVRAMADVPPLERHRWTVDLLSVVTDRAYHDAHLARLNDPSRLAADAQEAVRCASLDRDPEAPIGLVRLALEVRCLRRRLADPEPLFELAREGRLDAAARRLDLFPVDPAWRCVALGALALSAGEQAAAAAQDLVRGTAHTAAALGLGDEPAGRLAEVALALLAGTRNPVPPVAFPAPSREEAREIVAAYGTGRAVNISGMPGRRGFFDGSPIYAAEEHAPLLVAYALQDTSEGLDLILEYIRILGANPYAVYRDRSLYILLGEVLRHPAAAFVRMATATITAAVLAGARLAFEEALPLAALGLLAREDASAQSRFDAEVQSTSAAASQEAAKGNPEGDPWSTVLRRLAALAEFRALAYADRTGGNELISRALQLPRGYAGYRAPACLSLAEAARVVQGSPHGEASDVALSQALSAAHNIQDSDFCLVNTARVNAMARRWWDRPGTAPVDGAASPGMGGDAAQFARKLRDAPWERHFASVHVVGEGFAFRDRGSQTRQIEDEIMLARTPAAIAGIFHCHPDQIRQLDPGMPPDDVPIPLATEVSVPDPGLVPLIATRLAAELLCGPPGHARTAAAQALVPAALPDPTAADAVLARLMVLAAPPQPVGPAWRNLLETVACELEERRRESDMAERAYDFLGRQP